MVHNRKELIRLAQIYTEATEIPLSRLGTVTTGNAKLFIRLIAGEDCTLRAAERATAWFAKNWPLHLRWPKDVPPSAGVYIPRKRPKAGTRQPAPARRTRVAAAAG
jgi:hypothetical protein